LVGFADTISISLYILRESRDKIKLFVFDAILSASPLLPLAVGPIIAICLITYYLFISIAFFSISSAVVIDFALDE
jgi:hypothetical protein